MAELTKACASMSIGRALHRYGYGYATEVFPVACDEVLARILYATQTVLPHLVYPQLGSAAIAVLLPSKYPVEMVLVPIEEEHRIHYMLQHLRSGYAAFFGDVSDDDNGDTRSLAVFEQQGGTFTDLPHAAGRAFHFLGIDRLYRVYHEEIGCEFFCTGEYPLYIRFTVYEALIHGLPQSFGAHLQLPGTFFARHIERAQPGQTQHCLKDKRGLANPRLTAKQDKCSLDDSSSQYAVELLIAEADALFIAGLHVL